MFDLYFDEFDPEERKQILDNLQPDAEEEQSLEQIRTLFSLRYKKNRRGGYDDQFMAALMMIRSLPDENYAGTKRRKEKDMQRAMQILCLDSGRGFSTDILFAEMYQMIYYYMSLCMEDRHYSSVLFDLGRMNDERIVQKLQADLLKITETISTYAEEGKDHYQILVQAIEETTNDKLNTLERKSKSKQSIRKIDQR